jgi:HTH-type transcriptional regulator, sugar sensing transcriptional regulator
MMDTEVFKELGFTGAETKVYLALLKTGVTTAGPLLEETGLQNSTLHKTLNSLVNKGYASYVIKSKTKYYQAVNPDYLLKVQMERQQKLAKLLPKLKELQKPITKQKAEIFEGFKGLKNMLYEMIEDAKKGDEYLFFAFYAEDPDSLDNVYNFYKYFEKERLNRGIKVRGIAPTAIKDKFKGRKIENVLFIDMPIPMNIGIINDKIMFTPWEDSEVSILINSKQLADSFRTYFNSVWNSAKK